MMHELTPPDTRVLALLDLAEHRLYVDHQDNPYPMPSVGDHYLPDCRKLIALRRANDDALRVEWFRLFDLAQRYRTQSFRVWLVLAATSGNWLAMNPEWGESQLRAAALGWMTCIHAQKLLELQRSAL